MTETTDVIARRYACRAYTDQAVPLATLRAITRAGLQAPSAMNRQPWHIITVTDEALLDELEQVGLGALRDFDPAGYERILGRGGKLLYNAPVVIIVAKQPSEGLLTADLDVGIVASHLSLAATSLGIDNTIVGLLGLAFQGPAAKTLKQHLGFPAGYEFGIAVLLGYAAAAGTQHPVDSTKLTEYL